MVDFRNKLWFKMSAWAEFDSNGQLKTQAGTPKWTSVAAPAGCVMTHESLQQAPVCALVCILL